MSDRCKPISCSVPSLLRRRLFGLAAGGGLISLLPGCALPRRNPAVPTGLVQQATVLGVPNERFFPLLNVKPLEAEFMAAIERQRRTLGLGPDAPMPQVPLLAVSGGGEDGAFGAGLLCGWSQQGTRPVFGLVTGVSTGALTAPFAYLGSSYDPQLRAVYTGLSPDKIMESRGITAALFDDAMGDNAPLYRVISHYLTDQMLADIAKSYDEGRLLLIGTSDLDAQQPVIWNIGAIAKSGHPKASETIHRILLASAAVPGAFPPTMFDVTVNGQQYQEMHVDGGAFAQVFLYPPSVARLRAERILLRQQVVPLVAYVIRNARLDPEWSTVQRRTMSIAERAISTMIAVSGFNDILRIYANTQRDDVGFNLAYIGKDFTEKLPRPFDQGYMRDLFEYGYQHSIDGYHWAHTPPIG
jgi:predicted acylesterase/phospholipase RssA